MKDEHLRAVGVAAAMMLVSLASSAAEAAGSGCLKFERARDNFAYLINYCGSALNVQYCLAHNGLLSCRGRRTAGMTLDVGERQRIAVHVPPHVRVRLAYCPGRKLVYGWDGSGSYGCR